MKTAVSLTLTYTRELASFEPVRGRYDLDATSAEMQEISREDIEESIREQLDDLTGMVIKVEIFTREGHAISEDVPSVGNFLATRV